MVRRTIYVSELKYCFNQLELSPEDRLVIVKNIFDDYWTPDKCQYQLKSALRTIECIQREFSLLKHIEKNFTILINIFKPPEEDKSVPPELISLLSNGERLAIFIGAGVSNQLGIPTWEKLSKLSIEYIANNKVYSQSECKYFASELTDPKQMLTTFHSLFEMSELKSFYQENLKAKPEKAGDINIYDHLAKLHNVLKVTTNLEDYFGLAVDKVYKDVKYLESLSLDQSKYLNRKAERICVPSKQVKNLSNLDTENIYHLHGTIPTLEEAVLTTKSYVKAYYSKNSAEENPVYDFLESLFKEYTVLFIGTQLNEFAILERLLGRDIKKNRAHFALLPAYSNHLGEFHLVKQYLLDFGVTAIPYYIDYIGYNRLQQVLESWVRQIIYEVSNKSSFSRLLKIRRMLDNE